MFSPGLVTGRHARRKKKSRLFGTCPWCWSYTKSPRWEKSVYCCIMQTTASHWRTVPSHRKCAQLSVWEDDWCCDTFLYGYCRSHTDGSICPWTVTPWDYMITAEDSSSQSYTARLISPSLTWWQVQLEEEFQLVGERSTVQSICRGGILKQ